MTDDFIANLRNDWASLDAELGAVRRRLARARRSVRIVILAETAWALFGIVAGVWFAALAWRNGDVFFGLSAFTLLLAVPPTTIAVLKARSQMLGSTGETAEDMLRFALKRARATDTILTIGLWNAVALAAFVGVLWLSALTGRTSQHHPLGLFSAIWIGAVLVCLGWVFWRRRRNARERAECERLLAEYRLQ